MVLIQKVPRSSSDNNICRSIIYLISVIFLKRNIMVNIAGHHFVLEMDVSSFITVHSVEFMGIVQLDVFLCIVDHPIVAP